MQIMPNVDRRTHSPADKTAFAPHSPIEHNDSVDGNTDSIDVIGGRLHQSASDIGLSSAAGIAYGYANGTKDGIKRVYSEVTLSRDGSIKPTHNAAPEQLSSQRHPWRPQRSGQFTVSQYTLPESPTAEDLARLPRALVKNSKTVTDDKPKSQKSFASLARRGSWIIGSRSPSPSNRKLLREAAGTSEKAAITSSPNLIAQSDSPEDAGKTARPLLERRPTSSSSRSRRPLSAILSRAKSPRGDHESTRTVIPRSRSSDRLPLREYHFNVPEMPSLPAKERYRDSGVESPRKKDELWSAFRSLDGDFQKFSTKPGTLKANVIRTALLPFLKSHADHPSWKRLRPDDLDRRANILNKWWTGLLEMLNGRNGYSVSASDRPAVLEGISAIMARPEWRIPLSAIASVPGKGRIPPGSKSSSSIESNISDFLAESVIHNVRNIFVQNLLSQMAFVTERMSMRSVPASIVTFCGKATAFAFTFCPGVAEILVRLWAIRPDALRRVLEEHGHARNANLLDSVDAVAQHFPRHLQSLAFTSVAKTARYLRGTAATPLNSAYIAWDGPWKSRWAGRDSDLFFCFVKHYHVLTCEIVPDDATNEQRLAAPGNLIMQAQLLVVMEETIHRAAHNQHPEPFDGPLPITFDDVLGADASAVSVASSAPNSARSMAENRLIMLLRDFLGTAHTTPEQARSSFADLFGCLLKATARRISLYDHNACFTLCDFLEEAIAILSRYHRHLNDPGAFLDWSFWLNVLKQMGESNNTTTDMRLYAFLYSLWGYIAEDPARKREVCLNWLLREDYALRQFNHWCPMVRAYYMRLLCWRVVRFDGRATDVDVEIYKAAYQRLRTVWAHFLFIQRQASENKAKFLSTAPAHPAPQRRFLIIRNDSAPAPNSNFLSFDTMSASTSSGHTINYNASVDSLRQLTASPETEDPSRSKKRWSTLKALNPFSSGSPSPLSTPSKQSEKQSGSQTKEKQPSGRAGKRPTPLASTPSPTSITPPEQSPSVQHSHHSFKFSLEWVDRSLMPRERKLFPPALPAPAHQHLLARHPELAPPRPARAEPPPPPLAQAAAVGESPLLAQSSAASSAATERPPTNLAARSPLPHVQLTRPLPPPASLDAVLRYSGSALAEWAVLVVECHGFCERRRAEGVPELGLVETPTLGLEPFRRPVG